MTTTLLGCLTCDTPVAWLLFAPDAFTPRQLEEPSRAMAKDIAALNLPTWVIGAEQMMTPHDSVAWVMNVWPNREKAERLSMSALNSVFDPLQRQHCATRDTPQSIDPQR